VLDTELAATERARVLYNLGNASWRLDERFLAVGWYTAAVRLTPRHQDAWENLELARAETGLEPADRGDLDATVRRVLGSLTLSEARTLALYSTLFFALVLLIEALRGGRILAAFSGVACLATLALCLPWGYHLASSESSPMLVIRPGGATLRSEPRSALPQVASADPGLIVERIDGLPGWVRVCLPDGTRGWSREEAFFALDR
jgi:hypothetical protein